MLSREFPENLHTKIGLYSTPSIMPLFVSPRKYSSVWRKGWRSHDPGAEVAPVRNLLILLRRLDQLGRRLGQGDVRRHHLRHHHGLGRHRRRLLLLLRNLLAHCLNRLDLGRGWSLCRCGHLRDLLRQYWLRLTHHCLLLLLLGRLLWRLLLLLRWSRLLLDCCWLHHLNRL